MYKPEGGSHAKEIEQEEDYGTPCALQSFLD